jgi:hypothetical protein
MCSITAFLLRPMPLCEHELDSLQELVTVFANHWRVHYPDDATTPLLHNLVIDVPRFARLHGKVRHCVVLKLDQIWPELARTGQIWSSLSTTTANDCSVCR